MVVPIIDQAVALPQQNMVYSETEEELHTIPEEDKESEFTNTYGDLTSKRAM